MNIYKSAKGFLCAEQNGKNIHSRYHPWREAERFVQASIKGNPSIIILLGAGLGYIQEELSKKYPDIEILAFFYSNKIFDHILYKNHNIKCWHPSSGLDALTFFCRNIPEKYLINLAVLEWNPSSQIFPEMALEINKKLKIAVQQLNGNIKTTALFGKKWIRNMICNYLSIDTYSSFSIPEAPIVIASSGPNLSGSMKQIKKFRNKIYLWALPSSLAALNKEGIRPDLFITTDPGYYGSVHLNHLNPGIPILQPFTASRGVWKKSHPVHILNQELPFEIDLFNCTELENTIVPSNGTVSGTALELALKKTTLIYYAGLDLCFKDIQSHTRPHSFDALLQSGSFRQRPLHSIYFNRAASAVADFSRGIRISQSLDTYKNWFNSKNINSDTKVKRLNPSPIHIDNLASGNLNELEDFPDVKKFRISVSEAESLHSRKSRIKILLSHWYRGLQDGNRDDLLYYIDTDSFIRGERNSRALDFILKLRGIYD